MKRLNIYTTIVIISIFFLVTSCDTDSNVELPDRNFFLRMYGGDGDQWGTDFIALDDGTFLLLGNTRLGNATRMYLVKSDSEGKIIWEKKYGELGGVTLSKDIDQISGGFAILGTVETPSNGTDVKLIRIDNDGVPVDSTVYGYDKNDDAQSLTSLTDGGFIITGSTKRDLTIQDPSDVPIDPDAFSNIFHYRCNSDLVFNEDWYEFYGALGKFDFGSRVIEYANRFYVFGHSDVANQTGKLNPCYYSINAEGISSTVGTLGDNNMDTRTSFVCELPPELGGNLLLIGTTTRSPGDITFHVSTLRTPLRFNPGDDEGIDTDIVIGNTTLEAVSAAPSLVEPKGYLLLGNEGRTLGTNIWLTKIDQSARVLWSVSLGSERENDRAAAVKELPDGKIVVLGTLGVADNQTKMALFKLNSAGRLQE